MRRGECFFVLAIFTFLFRQSPHSNRGIVFVPQIVSVFRIDASTYDFKTMTNTSICLCVYFELLLPLLPSDIPQATNSPSVFHLIMVPIYSVMCGIGESEDTMRLRTKKYIIIIIKKRKKSQTTETNYFTNQRTL